jgi:hypothetical protein
MTVTAKDRGRVVAAAVNAGKISSDRAPHWLAEFARDPEGTNRVLASLAPALIPYAERGAADPAMERVSGEVLRRLGVAPRQAASGAVAASAPVSFSPNPTVGAVRDSAGMRIPGIPAPVRTYKGKPPEEWTSEEQWRYYAHKLGPAISAGVPPPPKPDAWYIPSSPNELSVFDEATGQFLPNPNYQCQG